MDVNTYKVLDMGDKPCYKVGMDYADRAKLFDNNASAIARHFGVKAPAVFRWKRIGKVPPLRVAELELQKLRGEGKK